MTRDASGGQLVWIVLAACLAIYGGKSIAMADNKTIVIDNQTGVAIIVSKCFGNSSTGCKDLSTIPPNYTKTLQPQDPQGDNDFALSFAYYSRDSFGLPMNCSSSGDFPEGSCPGAVATLVEFVKNAVTISLLNGYNFAVEIVFQCTECACPPIACAIPLSDCPEELRICDESGLPIACMAGTGMPSCQDDTASSSDFPSSVSTSCSLENVITKVKLSLLK